NPRRIPESAVRLSAETDHGSGIVAGRREKTDLGRFNRLGGQFGYFKEDDGAVVKAVGSKDVSLRQWLDNSERVVEALDCLHIFMQIVEIVSLAHSQGFVVQNVRPSCFVMSAFNRVSFIESVSSSDSGEDSCEDELNNQTAEFMGFEMLKSEFLNEPRDDLIEREAFLELKEKIEEQELLMEFLLTLQQRKQEAADNLRRTVAFISSDLQEVAKFQTSISQRQGLHSNNDDGTSSGSRKRIKMSETSNSLEPDLQENAICKSSRLMKNFKKLESAYFLTRRRALKPLAKPLTRNAQMSGDGKGSAADRSSGNSLPPINRLSQSKQGGWINSFIDGLSKYLSYRNLKVKADLKQGDLLNSSNLVCSLGFDRDGEFFATAGVNKKIKVFEYESILNENRDIHYPVVEMSSRSKLSSICWNNYIKGQIASSNFEGVVQIWDVTRNQVYMELKEHERRVWSVDFSWSNPTLVASGSDDGSVKLWNINQAILLLHLVDGTSVGTIKTKANVCCVQFPSDSGNTLAFGSADHRVYYYDLRNPSVPLFTLMGHNKTVSYVKFLDSSTLVSSSTDNTLKLWDLSEATSQVVDSPVQSFTGHMNVKNFVGLSVSDGYIATGSETNEVVVYHKAFPMPALSYKFNTTDPISGDEVDDSDQFISSVCWRVQSSTLVAANSMGNVKLLDMV
ncbi:hypothetical protein M8C21_025308, partial [Ambrosia artemisiifolia]